MASRGNPGNLDKEPSAVYPSGGRGHPAQLGRPSSGGRGVEKEGRKRREGEREGAGGEKRREEGGGGKEEQRRRGGEGRRGNPQELYPPRQALQS